MERHPSLDDRFDPAIRVADHDPAWAAMAAEEAERIEQALGAIVARVEHVGSTAVPGLAAKPIIDLQVSVHALEPMSAFVEPLEGLGYLFAPDPESPDYHYFGRPPERPRSFHAHVCEAGSHQELRHLAVRDFLRAHPEEAAAYGELKRSLAAASPEDRLEYIAGKDAYMKEIEARALAWSRS